MKRRIRRFSLMELMIVLLILGLLAALVVPNLMKKADKAKYKTGVLQLKLVSNAIKDYYLDMDVYPENLDDLVNPSGDNKWDGPYLDPPKIPVDPWGEAFHYQFPGQHGSFDLSSYGADKSPGGEKYDADINSWD